MIKNATTIILYFVDENNKKQVLLTKRKQKLFFLGGFHVYPGGKVDKSDYNNNLIKRITPKKLNKLSIQSKINDKELLAANIIAGIREVFEEVGIILFSHNKNFPVEESRNKLISKEISFNVLAKKYDFSFDYQIDYIEHFVTPDIFPVRFDTLFFVCKLERKTKVTINEDEIESYMWISPDDALKKNEFFEIYIIPPTKITLSLLSEL